MRHRTYGHKSIIYCILLGLLMNVAEATSPEPPIQITKKMIFLGPHPDDIVLTFGGFLETYKEAMPQYIDYMVAYNISNYTADGCEIDTNPNIDCTGLNADLSDDRINLVTGLRMREDLNYFNCSLFISAADKATYDFSHPINCQKYSKKIVNIHILGEPDALIRGYSGTKTAGGGPEGNFSDFRDQEIASFENIYNAVYPLLQTPNCSLFTLSAIGSHIDHFIVREAIIKAAYDLGDRAQCQIYFGEDQPYMGSNEKDSERDIQAFKARLQLKDITYPINAEDKLNSFLNNYPSQNEGEIYPQAILDRAKKLNDRDSDQGGERFYKWERKHYEKSKTDPSCKQDFCQEQ